MNPYSFTADENLMSGKGGRGGAIITLLCSVYVHLQVVRSFCFRF